jgi:type IV fimbrial biogenesis protein FimT
MNKGGLGGFTLYELLITLLVIAIAVTIGVPNLAGFTRNSRVTGLANDLHGSFMLARSEAARAKQNVTICASAAPFSAAAACDGAAFDDGWIVFLDRGTVGTRDATDPVLKAFPAAHDTIHINSNETTFSFAPTGLGTGAGALIAMICDERGNTLAPGGESAARRIVVSPIGRSTIIKTMDTINASIGTLGVDCT